MLVAMTLAWVGSAGAISSSFIEPASETANILVGSDISSTIFTSPQFGNLKVGAVTDFSTVLARVGLAQPGSGHMEGGGAGLSDLLTLRTFSSPTGAPVGFQLSFQSDRETGIPNPGGLTATIVETGLEQLLLSGTLSLQFVGFVDLTVTGRPDSMAVPDPAALLLFRTPIA